MPKRPAVFNRLRYLRATIKQEESCPIIICRSHRPPHLRKEPAEATEFCTIHKGFGFFMIQAMDQSMLGHDEKNGWAKNLTLFQHGKFRLQAFQTFQLTVKTCIIRKPRLDKTQQRRHVERFASYTESKWVPFFTWTDFIQSVKYPLRRFQILFLQGKTQLSE